MIKDHTLNGLFAGPTLRLMDKIGNARHGVALPYNYWPRQKWLNTLENAGMESWCVDVKVGNLSMACELGF